jgi:hypothetical protein
MTSEHGAYACMPDKQGYMHATASTHPRVQAPFHPPTHARTHARTYYLLLFTAVMIRKRAPVLRYNYIANIPQISPLPCPSSTVEII